MAELARRLVHASGAVVPALYLTDLLSWRAVQSLLVAGMVTAVVLESVRLFVGLDWFVFRKLTREYEQDGVAGYALYALSSGATALAFAPRFAVPAMLMLMLGDPVSGLVAGEEFRTVKRPRVLAVMFGVSATIAAVFVPLGAAVLGGLAAMVADGVKPMVRGHVVDDNLTIPVFAAVAMVVGVAVLPA